METVRVKNGYDLNIVGRPDPAVEDLEKPDRVALLPEHIPFIKPRLKVEVGDRVEIGSALIEDKRNPAIRFLSPGGGRVTDISFGPRRVIREIVIELDEDEKAVSFDRFSEAELETASREKLTAAIISGGLWPLIRALPFRDYACPDQTPSAIYIPLGSLEPFQTDPEVYLAGKETLFEFGLKAVQRLAEGRVFVSAFEGAAVLRERFGHLINLTYSGRFPAHDPGVLLYRMKRSAEQNRAWYIDGQDVLLLAHLLQFGSYPLERIVALGGSCARRRKHFRTRAGAPLGQIAREYGSEGDVRFICGGIFTGFIASSASYLGFSETSLNLLPEGNVKGELLSLFRPGARRPSFSRTFASSLANRPLEYDCNVHGGDRACIACYYCASVCPVDILPQFTYKALLAGEVEEALGHGLLDCVECGLCSYVCPSKIDLTETFRQSKADFYKEQEKA